MGDMTASQLRLGKTPDTDLNVMQSDGMRLGCSWVEPSPQAPGAIL